MTNHPAYSGKHRRSEPNAMESERSMCIEKRERRGEEESPILADLRMRLQASQEQATSARVEARRLTRELVLLRRLLRFSVDRPVSERANRQAIGAPSQRAVLLTAAARFHLDTCENQSERIVISGWAFRPVPTWDAREATATLIFRDGSTAYAADAKRVRRPDVAAYFATQPAEAAGGASGLEAAGFSCSIPHESLPAGTGWEIVLRLECAGAACELVTGQQLRR